MTNCIDHGEITNLLPEGYKKQKLKGVGTLLHRIKYILHNGVTMEDIKGKVVRHTCDNPRCVNPEHLIIGTIQDNVMDKVQRNRQQRSLTPEQVIEIQDTPKKRGVGIALAAKFNVTPALISLIINGKWKPQYGDKQ